MVAHKEIITASNLVSQYQLMCFFNKVAGSVSFIIFFQKAGSTYISCCHLKLEKLLKPNSSLILLEDLTFKQGLGFCQKNNE